MTKEGRDIVITRGTKIVIPIVLLFSLIGCAWWIRGSIDEYKQEQAQGFSDLSKHMDQRYWDNHNELSQFAYGLDQDNRSVSRGDGKSGLIVPPVIINSTVNRPPIY